MNDTEIYSTIRRDIIWCSCRIFDTMFLNSSRKGSTMPFELSDGTEESRKSIKFGSVGSFHEFDVNAEP